MMVVPLSGGHVKRVDATLMLRATEAVRFAERVMVRVLAVCAEIPSKSFQRVEFYDRNGILDFVAYSSHQNQFVLPCFLVHPFRLFFHSAPWSFIR